MAIKYRGTGTSGNSGATTVTSQAITLPTGFTAGDILFMCIRIASAAITGFSQTGGTGTWTVDFEAQYATGAFTYAVAHRVMAAGDTAPTFGWTTAGGTAWSCGGFFSDAGNVLSLDRFAAGDPAGNASAGNSITPNAATAAQAPEASIILTLARSPVARTNASHTYTPPAGWTWNDGDGAFFSSGTQNARFAANAYQLGVSGTVTPGSQSLTDAGGDIFFFVVFHALVQEAVRTLPRVLLRGRAAAVKGRLASIQVKPPVTVIPSVPAPFFPPHTPLRGAMAAVKGKLTAARGLAGRPSPFRLPGPLRGTPAARKGILTGQRGRPGIPAPFTPPGRLAPPPAYARPGRLTGARGRPGVPAPFTAPHGPLHGQQGARQGTLKGIVAPPPVIQPNVPAPFFPPHVLLRGQAPVMARTRIAYTAAPPPAPPPQPLATWQGSTHIVAADASGNLIQGARHTGKGGPGTDLKGDYERSGD